MGKKSQETLELNAFIDFIRLATGKDPLHARGCWQDYRGNSPDATARVDLPAKPRRKVINTD